jgi:hypothetical protein
MPESTPKQLRFPPVAGFTVRGDFDGGAISSELRTKGGRVTAGDCSPAVPTDPDVPDSGIRLLGLNLRYVA